MYFWSQPAIWAIIHGRTVLSEGKHKFGELLKTSDLAYDEHMHLLAEYERNMNSSGSRPYSKRRLGGDDGFEIDDEVNVEVCSAALQTHTQEGRLQLCVLASARRVDGARNHAMDGISMSHRMHVALLTSRCKGVQRRGGRGAHFEGRLVAHCPLRIAVRQEAQEREHPVLWCVAWNPVGPQTWLSIRNDGNLRHCEGFVCQGLLLMW